MIAKTAAAGGPGLHPEVLAFTSSLAADRSFLREDLLGSLAHLTMLARQRIVPAGDARTLRTALLALWDEAAAGRLDLPNEEDVHMAVEAELTRRVGEVAGRLHTARSRNDQVALDLKLYTREGCGDATAELAVLLTALADRAEAERETILPSYTHRQRAQPISAAYLFCSYGAMFERDAQQLHFVTTQLDTLPLGVGAIAGTSLPIDRQFTRELLGFRSVTLNGLDTVGDRDFLLDFAYASARCLTHTSRIATDVIDFSSSEFGFLKLDGEIACGSSLMPQKRNPDLFELIRGKTGGAVGNLMGLFTILRGLPCGYNRDLQEDRALALTTAPLLLGVLRALKLGLERVQFDRKRCLAAVEGDQMQATDLAEALVRKGLPFRTAYLAVGELVAQCRQRNLGLSAVRELGEAVLHGIHPAIDADLLNIAEHPAATVERKESEGGTGPASVARQIAALREVATRCEAQSRALPRTAALFAKLREMPL